jgi:hypothetical protein
MKNRRLLSLGLLSLLLTTGALAATAPQDASVSQITPPLLRPEPPKWEDRRSSSKTGSGQGFEASRLRQVVADLPAKASVDQVELALYDVLPQIYRATNRDLPVVAEAVAKLREQPGAVEAIARQYKQLPTEALEHRLVVLGMLGEMKRSDAMAQLREVVWAPLPPADSQADKLTARDFEEMVQVKAVQGLAFLATPQADAAVRDPPPPRRQPQIPCLGHFRAASLQQISDTYSGPGPRRHGVVVLVATSSKKRVSFAVPSAACCC